MIKAVQCINDEVSDLVVEDYPDDLQENFSISNVHSMRCAAHTLQLCVIDIHKEVDIKCKLELARNVVKTLRTPNKR